HWEGPAGGIIGTADSISAVANIPGEYYYLYALDTLLGCENYDSVFVSDLTVLPIADINIVEQITCVDSDALLDIGSSSTGQNIVYTWSGPGLNNIVSNSIEPTLPGQYYLDVVNEETGCAARDTADLILPMEPQDLLADISIPICEGDTSGQITIANVTGGTPPYMYSLDGSLPQSSPVFTGIMAGNYTIAVVDANGCTYSEQVSVADGLALSINIGPDIDLVLGDSTVLSADVSLPWSQIDSIVWTPMEVLSCTHCISPTLYGLHSGVVTATVYTAGCMDQDMLNVRVDIDYNIYIPNVFSPNDDGINDHVTVFTDDKVRKIVYLEIFDRWGNQVFVANNILPNDPLLGWDGSFRGKKMNPAVFVYIARVELINGDTVDRKGDITIIR
ncbi:MAG TPA: gliding motility-associated C-terminal domain-containing protein, partial [Saprospiraceae bacterium]